METIKYQIEIPVCPACKGKWKHYDGCLGYESLKCEKCGLDIQDIEIVIKKGTAI